MKYTYLFTQINREENGNLVPVTDNPHEFVFTFGKKIETFLGESPNDTVLLTKDMWKEHPATNEELLKTVCFSTPSQRGYRRPLVMSKDADVRVGWYKYEKAGEPIDIKKDQYLSDKIKTLTETFVKGVKAVNEDKVFINCEELESANTRHLMSYIKSEVYKHLLQDKDNRGIVRAEEFLKNVLVAFFSLIPDSIIEKFDKGLEAHDDIREELEGVPENDTAKINAILKSQGYFKTFEDYKMFVALRKYILGVKNRFNHLVWIMYRSKIGLVSLKNVKKQLSGLFDFMLMVQENCEPLENKDIIKAICSGDRYYKFVEGFLNKIFTLFEVYKLNKSEQAALCYKFQEECHYIYLNSRFYYEDEIVKEEKEKQKKKGNRYKDKDIYKSRNQEQFRDLCLRYWGINKPNSYKPNQCSKQKEKYSGDYYDKMIWNSMKEKP